MRPVFHAGELDVQSRAGVRDLAGRVARSIQPFLPSVAQEFLRRQVLAVVASLDSTGKVWASALTGPPGFIEVPDSRSVKLNVSPVRADPLVGNLAVNDQVGLIAIEFASRRRILVNGRARLDPDGHLLILVQQAYSNCPKYIQRRIPKFQGELPQPAETLTVVGPKKHLDDEQQSWIQRADTFFVASYHPEAGADASHRGGNPGFVRVDGANRLLWPDYSGNAMFQTLGNVASYPQAGLLFIDFEKDRTLQLTGTAQIIWEAQRVSGFPGAERLVEFEVGQVVEISGRGGPAWGFVDYSPFNPG
ncbi:MAG: pyridoxamine 5'-phosphate oxidase family protein [Acidobacteriota bacterium]